jgi:hypothetical protein
MKFSLALPQIGVQIDTKGVDTLAARSQQSPVTSSITRSAIRFVHDYIDTLVCSLI